MKTQLLGPNDQCMGVYIGLKKGEIGTAKDWHLISKTQPPGPNNQSQNYFV